MHFLANFFKVSFLKGDIAFKVFKSAQQLKLEFFSKKKEKKGVKRSLLPKRIQMSNLKEGKKIEGSTFSNWCKTL